MSTIEKATLKVETTVKRAIDKVWNYWINPKHIKQWNNASPDWYTPHADSDFRVGGKFVSRMEARDGSAGFDFTGVFDVILPHEYIEFTLADGRKVNVSFTTDGDITTVTENFEAEDVHTKEMQVTGWQAILDNFKSYSEAQPMF